MRRRLRVVSWNVGRLYSPRHNNRLDDADVPEVAAVLGELHPDVILLQELIDERQLAALKARIAPKLGAFAGAIATKCGYDRHVAALARTELAPTFEEAILGSTTRGVVTVRFTIAGDGDGDGNGDGDGDGNGDGNGERPSVAGAALSAHFDVFDAERRAEQGDGLAALAEARPEPLVIAGGDLNLDPLFAAGTHNLLDVRTFARLTRNFVDSGRDSGATLLGVFRVDHLFVKGAAHALLRVSPRRLPLGDHHPLVLDVDVDPT
jgi:endonuclease/exonuclease/phosphatase family metal-dependent hydrolase